MKPEQSQLGRAVVFNIGAIMIASLMLCWLAFHNGYPLVFNNDSGMYIENAFEPWVPSDRPILYGLFIYYTSLGYSLWLVVAMQALLVATIIFYYFRYFASKNSLLWYLGFIATVSFLMSASFEVSWVMPDVFTAITILSFGLLLFVKRATMPDKVIIGLIAILSIGVHNSHFFIGLMLVAAYLTVTLFKSQRARWGISFSSGLSAFGVLLTGQLLLGCIQYYYSGSFKTSRGGSIFLISNLIEMGVVNIYLDENCGPGKYGLCKYRDSLPNNFLWDERSPIKTTGGWDANEREYSRIIWDMAKRPEYLKTIFFQSGVYTFKQFFNYDVVDIWIPSERIDQAIATDFRQEYGQFLKNREYRRTLHVGLLNFLQDIVVAVCVVYYCWALIGRKMSIDGHMLIVFLLAALLINAFICGTLSGVFPRYQTRVIWLLPLPLFLHATRSIRLPFFQHNRFTI